MKMQNMNFNGRRWQQKWTYDEKNGAFHNIYDLEKFCVGVEGSKDEEGAQVKTEACNNGAGQKWKILYEDKAEKAKTKGMNTDFGMEINRPFFIVSKMFGERVIECIGANNLVLRTPVPKRDRKA